MVAKKEIRDSRLTFTINPEIEKRFREKVEAEKRTISGVIVSLLEKWLSDEPIHTDVTDMNHSLPLPPIVDIERMKAEVFSEVMKAISTMKKEEPVQSALVHTDMNQCESITEAPTSPDNDVTHTNIPPKEETSIPKRYEAVNTGKLTPDEKITLANMIDQFVEDFNPVTDAYMKENGIPGKDRRKAMKALYGFDNANNSSFRNNGSLSRDKYNEYIQKMAEARKKYESVHTDMNTT